MSDRDLDRPEVREAINKILRDSLGTDEWAKSSWDSLLKTLHSEFGIVTDLLDLAKHAPGLLVMFQIGALTEAGIIGKEARKTLSEIIHKLVRIAYHAEKGDQEATNQLHVLHKIAHPFTYDLPATVIETLVESYHTSPHLARAWAIRSLMSELAYVVEPVRDGGSLLKGPIQLTTWTKPITFAALYDKAKLHIKRGSTLQSVAIAIYMEQLEEEGISLDLRQIRGDFVKLREWESLNFNEEHLEQHSVLLWNSDETLPPIPLYSDGWKRLWRRGDKKSKKLSPDKNHK